MQIAIKLNAVEIDITNDVGLSIGHFHADGLSYKVDLQLLQSLIGAIVEKQLAKDIPAGSFEM